MLLRLSKENTLLWAIEQSLSLSSRGVTSGLARVNRLNILLCIFFVNKRPPNEAKTMPIAGLPAELEGVLEVLFMQKVLTSWKIAGEGY